ncbi:MBL fold metallo-hydrolase [Candidatus Poriferisocius sp.]|uniref:MBL fold metallo-hydrolase n=1 Tax=Candidatus Poriferisocius sp. TaxID=3101276 RepID=UPI003B5BBD39
MDDVKDRVDGWAVTRLHNAMTIIEVDDARILTDPWFTPSRAFRKVSPVRAEEVGELTAIIGSHWVKDHFHLRELAAYPRKDLPIYVCSDNMVKHAEKHGFTNAETLEWGATRSLTRTVTLEVYEEHIGRGRRTNNYGVIGPDARVFFGGEVLDLDAIRRCGEANEPFDVVIGPVNGVHLMGRQLSATANEMLEATRLLGTLRLVAVHDEHKPFGPLLKVTSSIRDLDGVDCGDIEVIELDLGGKYRSAA